MARLNKLFERTKIGSMELKNRLCFGELGMPADEEGYVTQQTIDFYVERAKGGTGLVMVGGSYPSISGANSRFGARLNDDKYIPKLAKMAKLIHEASEEVKVGVQIQHCGRRIDVHARGAVPGITPVAPSAIACRYGTVPHALTTEEVQEVVEQYAEASRRIKEAGFDCVGLHGAHGYLISQFLSPYSNKRTDKYGGTPENRARFACEIIQRIKQKCGNDFPVLIKINADDYLFTEEQITIEYAKVIASLLERAGADEITVSAGDIDSPVFLGCSSYMVPKGVFVEHAAQIKNVVNIPVGAINGITDPLLAEQILRDEKADLIWMARPLVADPELPIKASEGRLDEIRTCIRCLNCIELNRDDEVRDWRCAINPEARREHVFTIVPTARPKKVLIIGGGPGGMEAARVAALIGHDVTIWEKDKKLGGQLILASIPLGKQEFAELIRYFSTQIKKLGVKVELGKEATLASVKEMNPDAVIIATGSKSLIPPVPGINRSNVVDARDVVAGRIKVGDAVAVIGGGEVGMEAAQMLAELGKKITMVVRTKMGKGMVKAIYKHVHGQLAEHGAEMLSDTRIEEVTDTGVAVIDKDQRKRFIEADTIVLAAGAKSDRSLYDVLEDIVPEIYLAGDCLYPGNIRSAIYQGASVARMLDNWQGRSNG